MSGKYATPLHLELGPSRRMGAWLLLVHLPALLLLPFAVLPAPAVALIVAAVPLGLAWYWPRYASRTAPDCVHTLTWGEDGDCRLLHRDGAVLHARLHRQAFVQPWMVILPLAKPGRRRRHLVILPDMLDGASFRRLRVRLRLEAERSDARG